MYIQQLLYCSEIFRVPMFLTTQFHSLFVQEASSSWRKKFKFKIYMIYSTESSRYLLPIVHVLYFYQTVILYTQNENTYDIITTVDGNYL